MASEKQVRGLLRAISGAYPTFELTDDRVSIYVKLLADLDAEALIAACQQHIATSKFPPTVAELREACASLTRPALPAWADAWGEVLEAIRRVGYLGQPSFSHPLITQAVHSMGGWKLLCAMEISETATQRAQFRDVYNAYATRAARDADLLPAARAIAAQHGALPAPVEATPPALPAPSEPARPAVDAGQPIKLAAYVRQWRAGQRAVREAHGRAVAEEAAHV